MDNYPLKIYQAFDHNSQATNLLEDISKTLNDLFNFFEPAYFNKAFYVIKDLHDNFILSEEKSKNITFNKEQLLEQNF